MTPAGFYLSCSVLQSSRALGLSTVCLSGWLLPLFKSSVLGCTWTYVGFHWSSSGPSVPAPLLVPRHVLGLHPSMHKNLQRIFPFSYTWKDLGVQDKATFILPSSGLADFILGLFPPLTGTWTRTYWISDLNLGPQRFCSSIQSRRGFLRDR